MSHPDIKALAQQWLTEGLEELEEQLLSMNGDSRSGSGYEEDDAYDMALSDCLESTEIQLMNNDLSKIRSDVDELLKAQGVAGLPKDLYKRLCRELLKAKQVYFREAIERSKGRYPSNGIGVPQALPATPQKTPAPLMSKVIPEYMKAFERRAPGTLLAKQNVFKRFLSIVGDKPLSSISEKDLLRYRETLTRLPTNMGKRFPGKTVAEVLKIVEGMNIGRISLATINMDLTHLSHFFGWSMAKPRRYLQENPVDGLFYEDVEAESYEPYTEADLKAMFLSAEFQAQRKNDPPKYWLPLVLCLSGCRREEIANLTLSDIKNEGGIDYFDVAPDPKRERRLKTKSSRRIVPVHSALIALGFLKYVAERVERGERLATTGALLLFSKETKGRTTVGDSVMKWWGRLLKAKGIVGKKKTLHSFRPTITTKLHEAGVDGETRRQLLGHAGRDVHETVYLRPQLPVLKAALEKLRYDWLV